MAARVAEERAIERAGRAGRGGGGRARLRSALAGGAAMLAGRCVSGSGAGGAVRAVGRPGRAGAALPRAARGSGRRLAVRGGCRRPCPSGTLCLRESVASGGRAAGVRGRGRNRSAAGAQPGAGAGGGRRYPNAGGSVPPLRGQDGARSRPPLGASPRRLEF